LKFLLVTYFLYNQEVQVEMVVLDVVEVVVVDSLVHQLLQVVRVVMVNHSNCMVK
jgi:hypothetical protein